jgi:hypothetical protein
MTRDARSLRLHEPVILHTSPYVSRHGRFLGVTVYDRVEYLRVELSDQTVDVLPTAVHVWVTDTASNVLTIPEPVLETIPPDLE